MSLALISNVIFSINLILILFLIFVERKNPSVTWAWVLILSFIPILGFIVYVLFGQNLTKQKMFSKKIISDKEKQDYIDNISANYKNDPISDKYASLIKMNQKNADATYTQNNKIMPFFDGKDLFEDIFKELEKSKEFIHIEFYIFKTDDLGKRFMDILIKKAKEGVEVKLLIDALGNGINKQYIKALEEAGGKYSVFFRSILKYVNKRINYRNHRKIIIIDGKTAYLGGFNVGNEYIGEDKNIGYWRDTHLKIQGNAINELQTRFILDWTYTNDDYNFKNYLKYFKKPQFNYSSVVGMQIVSSGPDHDKQQIKNGYIKIINDAKKNVFIQTPYFVPDDCMFDCIKMAATSGVDVRLMIPKNPDHIFMSWIANSYLEELLESGVKVYLYNNGFIHSKCIVSDCSVCSIGTANMDIRSFQLNFETNAFIYNEKICNQVENQFLKDIKYCNELTLKSYKNRSVANKFFEPICRLISPLA